MNVDRCDICGIICTDCHSADGAWVVCDTCEQAAPSYVRDYLAGTAPYYVRDYLAGTASSDDADAWLRDSVAAAQPIR